MAINIFRLIIIFLLSFFQTYWAMKEYADTLSSNCINCNFIEDLIMYSIIIVVFFSIIIFFIDKLKNKPFLITVLHIILLIIFWLWANYNIFNERVASWSTFGSLEIWNYVIDDSIIPILTSSVIYLFVYLKIEKIIKVIKVIKDVIILFLLMTNCEIHGEVNSIYKKTLKLYYKRLCFVFTHIKKINK